MTASLIGRVGGRLRGRPDSEHEQAIIRFILGAIIAYYLFHVAVRDGAISSTEWTMLWFGLWFLGGAVAIFALILARPGVSVARRYAGMVLDITALSTAFALNGRLAAPAFPVYLWVTFGNGFRYGQAPFAVAAVLSVVGFTIGAVVSDFLAGDPFVAAGFLAGLVVLPLYVSFLLAKFTDAMRRAKAADEARTHFLANVGHEVLSPLHVILGMSEVLLDGKLGPEQRRSVLLVHRSATWLLDALEAVLELSRLRAGRTAVEESDFDLPAAAGGLVEIFREVAGPEGPRVELRLGAEVPRAVRGDRVKLLQVLQALLRNAVKFTPAGSVTLAVDAAGTDGERLRLRFSVADTGVGIAPEAQARLFEPFGQERAPGAGEQGPGLGLALARDLVATLGGELGLESAPGRGTTVTFTVALAPGDEAAAARSLAPEPESLPRAPAWRARPRVLVAEDNPLNRELASRLLARFGCDAVFAENGLQAVEAVTRERFDLVLMDCQMPEMDGYEAAREIRRRLPPGTLPIVAVTAYVRADHDARCRAAGMDDFIAKPYRAAELLAVLTRQLAGHLAPGGGEGPATPQPDDLVGAGMPSGGIAPRAAVHEINNALTGLLGYADLLAMSLGDDPRLKGYADRIVDAGERARQILLALPRA